MTSTRSGAWPISPLHLATSNGSTFCLFINWDVSNGRGLASTIKFETPSLRTTRKSNRLLHAFVPPASQWYDELRYKRKGEAPGCGPVRLVARRGLLLLPIR